MKADLRIRSRFAPEIGERVRCRRPSGAMLTGTVTGRDLLLSVFHIAIAGGLQTTVYPAMGDTWEVVKQ